MIHLFKESPSTIRMMFRVTAKGSYKLGVWYIGLTARHLGIIIPYLSSLISDGYEPTLKLL